MASSKTDATGEIELVRRCQRGETEAFRPLIERYQKRVFGIVFHLVRRRDEVEDLAQDIFLKAFAAVRSYNFRASFGTWLSRVAVNHCYDYLRRQRVARVSYHWQASGETSEPEQGAERARATDPSPEQRVVLGDLVGKLLARASVSDRIILSLKELEELSVEEIAEILELKPSTVKVRLHRARKRMLEDWKRLRQKGGQS